MNPELFHKIITSFHVIQGHINKLDVAYSLFLRKGKLEIQKRQSREYFAHYTQAHHSHGLSEHIKSNMNYTSISMLETKPLIQLSSPN